MSRELKFRAWDSEYPEMILLQNSGLQYFDFEGSYSLGFTVDGYSGFWAHEQYESATKEAKKFPIMQYTGLKDKNGVEIYEGDIISCSNYTMYGGKYIVEYDNDLSMWVTKLPHVQATALYKHQDIEVIGNIHQNPELL